MSKDNAKAQANDIKNKYVKRFSGPGKVAAMLGAGTGAAVAIDKGINSEAEHAATMMDVVQGAYQNDPEVAAAVSYVYGNVKARFRVFCYDIDD